MKLRSFIRLAAGCLALAALADSCAPSVTVVNNTDFTVRAIVIAGYNQHVLSPSPGESASAEAVQGPYAVYVIPDKEWVEHAQAVRQFLSAQLADPQGLSTAQIEDMLKQLQQLK
jgi:hypothetical protein